MTWSATLPWPPSVNGYWRSICRGTRTGQIISQKAREYRKEVDYSIGWQGSPKFGADVRLMVRLDLYPPDKRKRDVDNYSKGLIDALTHSGVWSDDSQIDVLLIERKPPGRGCVVVTVNDIPF